MTNIREIMKIRPDTIYKAQHKALKKHVTDKLKEVLELIENENYQAVEKLLCGSPAGDCMGTEKSFIDFTYDHEDCEQIDGLDIEEVCNMLTHLKHRMENDV